MKIKLTVLFLSVLLLNACRSKPFQGGSASKEELVRDFIGALSQGDPDTVRKYLIRKQEYIEGIHPYTPEAKGIGGEELWNTMIIRKRDMLTDGQIQKFKGKTCSVAISGNEKKKEKHGPVTFYRQIPVKIVCGDKENLYTDENKEIFAIIVEKYGIYKVLNSFND